MHVEKEITKLCTYGLCTFLPRSYNEVLFFQQLTFTQGHPHLTPDPRGHSADAAKLLPPLRAARGRLPTRSSVGKVLGICQICKVTGGKRGIRGFDARLGQEPTKSPRKFGTPASIGVLVKEHSSPVLCKIRVHVSCGWGECLGALSHAAALKRSSICLNPLKGLR